MSRRRRGAESQQPVAPWNGHPIADRPEYRRQIDDGRLERVDVRPGLARYLREIWQRREFMLFESRSKVLTKHSGNRLGSLWLIGKPLLDAAFYYLFFGVILGVDRGVENFPAFIIIGILMFQFTSASIGGSVNLLRNNRAMMRSFRFPRASLAVSATLRDVISLLPVVTAMLVAIMVIPPHAPPALIWPLILPVIAMQMLLNLGFRLVVSRIGAILPDVSFAMSFLNRLLLYGSGIIFPIDRFIDDPTMRVILTNNPIFIVIDMYRTVLIDQAFPDAHQWIVGSAWAVGLLLFGFIFFWRGEDRYGRL